MMPRIGTVIRDVYRRPGAGALPAHLEDHYGIRVAAMTKLDTGVFRVERDDGPPLAGLRVVQGKPGVRAGPGLHRGAGRAGPGQQVTA